MESKDCTANGVFKYDHPFNTVPLHYWVQAVNNQMSYIYYWENNLKSGTFGFDNMCMSIGRLFQNFTFDIEEASSIVHNAWIENYTFWVSNKPWNNGYEKPLKSIRSKRRERYAITQYVDLPEDEKDKDRVIAKYIINNHLEYQQFVKSFAPHKIEDLNHRVLRFHYSSDPFSIRPTMIMNETKHAILRKHIDEYKNNGQTYVYDFNSSEEPLYICPSSQVALTMRYRDKLEGSRGVVISIDDVDGEELPLIKFLDEEELYVNYINGKLPLMMASFMSLSSNIKFKLEMCSIDGDLIGIEDMGRALEKSRSFDCIEVRNLPSWVPDTVFDLIIDPNWKDVMVDAFKNDDKFKFIKTFSSLILSESETEKVFPYKNQIFYTINTVPFDCVKVIIISKDPYHTPNNTHNLLISSRKPSLKNIYKELIRTGFTAPSTNHHHADLTKWAEQGVLLLHSTLTAYNGKVNPYIAKGWERIMDEIIQQVNSIKDNIVFMLWGSFALKKYTFIDINRHYILKSAHPSPMTTGYVGCNCFCDANKYLNDKGLGEINWNLS